MNVYKYCVRCRRSLSEKEVQEGLVLSTDEGLICDRCISVVQDELEMERSGGEVEVAEEEDEEDEGERGEYPEAGPDEEKGEEEEQEEGPEEEGPIILLDEIHRDVRRIYRLMQFEKSSLWTVFGAVAQCFALGMLFMAAAYWTTRGNDLLLLAVVVQLMALTFFVKGK